MEELGRATEKNTKHYMKDRDIYRVRLFTDLAQRLPALFLALDSLDGKEYIDSYMKICNKVLPELKAVEMVGEGERPMIIINNSGKTIKNINEGDQNG